MKRRPVDRHGRPVPNAKLIKRGPNGGWRIKDAKLGRLLAA